MAQSKRRFSDTTYFYTYSFLVLLCMFPLILNTKGAFPKDLLASSFVVAVGCAAVIVASLILARARCGTPDLTYIEGLLYVAATMQTGWSYASLLVVFPALLVAYFASVGLALASLVPGRRAVAARGFRKLIQFSYRNRMIQ